VSIRFHRITAGLAAAGIVVSTMVAAAPPARAASNGTWAVAPTGSNGSTPRDFFQYSMSPGQALRDMVSISNLSNSDKQFAIYAKDAYNTPIDGGFALLDQNMPSKDAGAWITLGYSKLTVPKHSRADLVFQINVPPDALPGDHAAGIIAEDISPQAPRGQGQGVDIQRRVASRVFIRVGGALRPALTVTQLGIRHADPLLPPFTGKGSAVVSYEITNTGNQRLTSTAILKIKGFFGRTLKAFKPRALPELLPKGSVVVTERWSGLPIIDRVQAQVTVTGGGAHTVRTKAFWKIPWIEVLIVLALIALWDGRRRYRRWRDARPEPPTPQPAVPEAVLV
jgi:hypothetical protein